MIYEMRTYHCLPGAIATGRAKYAKEFGGPLVSSSDSMFLKAARYSPLE